MLRRDLPEEVVLHRGRIANWRELAIYQAPLATIKGWLNETQQISDVVVSTIAHTLSTFDTHCSERTDREASTASLPTNSVEPASDASVAIPTENDSTKTAKLRELYSYYDGKEGVENILLRQAIFWTVYEAEGHRSIEKTHSLLGLMQGTQERCLKQIHISPDLQSRLLSGEQNWRDLHFYQDAIAQIDKSLNTTIAEEQLTAAPANITHIAPTVAPAIKRKIQPEPASSFVEALIGEGRIVPVTRQTIDSALEDNLALERLLGHSQEAEQRRLERLRDDSREGRKNLLGKYPRNDATFSDNIQEGRGFTVNDKRRFR